MVIYAGELSNIKNVKGKRAVALIFSYFLENQYPDLEPCEVKKMFEFNYQKWLEDPDSFSKNFTTNMKIYLLVKKFEK